MGGIREEVNHFSIYGEGVIFDDGILRVTAIPTGHVRAKGRPSFAFLIEAEGKRLFFTGDLSHGLRENDFPEIIFNEYFDLVVCESTHFELNMVFPSFKCSRIGRLVFNHVDTSKIPEIVAERDSGEYTYPISVAYDGYTLEI